MKTPQLTKQTSVPDKHEKDDPPGILQLISSVGNIKAAKF